MKKKISLLACILLSATAIVIITFNWSCTKEGPHGLPGADGNATCNICHNESTKLLALQLQHASSKHAAGNELQHTNTSCAPCHTSEGFTEAIKNKTHTIETEVNNPTPINCRTCHNIHANYDSTDYTLVTETAIQLAISVELYDFGKANLCARCHQPFLQNAVPQVHGGIVAISSSYWGLHYASQATMLAGTGGYEIAGSEAYENSEHSSIPDGCVTCHISDTYGLQAGGHTFNMRYTNQGKEEVHTAGCTLCHENNSMLKTSIKNTKYEIQNLMNNLKTKLLTAGIINDDNEPVPGSYTSNEAGALMNYLFVYYDGSNGVHNAGYAKALLKNSIESLQ